MKAQAVALFFFFPFPSLFLFLLKPKRVLSPLPPSPPPRSALLPGGAEGSGAFQHGPRYPVPCEHREDEINKELSFFVSPEDF